MFEIEVVYINIDSAVQRRTAFLKHFYEHVSNNWHLTRFSALTPALDFIQNAPGKLPRVCIACASSHYECMRQSLQHDKHQIILEDDVLVGPHTERLVHNILASLPEDAWDIISLNAQITNAVDWPRLLKNKKRCMEENIVELVDLQRMMTAYSAQTSAYIINRKSKAAVFRALTGIAPDQPLSAIQFQAPIDILLRSHTVNGYLKGFLTVPFLVSATDESDLSQMESEGFSLELKLLNVFRRLMWVDNQHLLPDFYVEKISHIQSLTDPDAQALGVITAMMLARQLAWHSPACRVPAKWALPVG